MRWKIKLSKGVRDVRVDILINSPRNSLTPSLSVLWVIQKTLAPGSAEPQLRNACLSFWSVRAELGLRVPGREGPVFFEILYQYKATYLKALNALNKRFPFMKPFSCRALRGGALISLILLNVSTPRSLAGSDKILKPLKSSPNPSNGVQNATFQQGPTSTADDPYADEIIKKPNDTCEGLNRQTFKFNHQFYRFVARPIAKVTTFIIPPPVLNALGNALENLESPVRITSCVLQGKAKRAAQETGKLVLNSTVGVGGLWKPSDRVNSLKNVPPEDLGQTFGNWGIPQGPYLVLPVLGPSSIRDAIGKGGDKFLHPARWVPVSGVKTATTATQAVVENPDRLDVYDAATKDALDPYIGMREAYLEYRAAAVRK